MASIRFVIEGTAKIIGSVSGVSVDPVKNEVIIISGVRYKVRGVEQEYLLTNLGVDPQSNPDDIYPRELDQTNLSHVVTNVLVIEE